MKKKIIITLVTICIISLVFLIVKGIIFGWDTEYINMMPGPILSVKNGNIVEIGYSTGEDVVEYEVYNFKDNYNIEIISLKRLTIFFLLNIFFTTMYSVVVYKNKIYNKKIDVLLSLLVLFIPLLITYFVICSQFSVVV